MLLVLPIIIINVCFFLTFPYGIVAASLFFYIPYGAQKPDRIASKSTYCSNSWQVPRGLTSLHSDVGGSL